jgi:hypothetical protein
MKRSDLAFAIAVVVLVIAPVKTDTFAKKAAVSAEDHFSQRAGAGAAAPASIAVNKAKFTKVYTAATRLVGAVDSGVTKARAMTLIEDLNTEVLLVTDQPLNRSEKILLAFYGESLFLLNATDDVAAAVAIANTNLLGKARALYLHGTIPTQPAVAEHLRYVDLMIRYHCGACDLSKSRP